MAHQVPVSRYMYSLICYIYLPFSAQQIISNLDRANVQNLVSKKKKYKADIAESTLDKQENKHEERRKEKKNQKGGRGRGQGQARGEYTIHFII